MKIYTKGTALAAAAMFALATAAPASADHVDVVIDDGTAIIDCVSLGGLSYTLAYYIELANEDKDREPLEKKLADADAALTAGKTCGAALKVEDFATKIDRLQPDNRKQKIFETFAGALYCLESGATALAADLREGENCGDAGDPPRGKGPNK